jgi:putative SOS response-associated peptidase YedK
VRRAAKQPFFIRAVDQRPLALAGLWERWQGADGTRIESCTVLTTTPNELLHEVHDRMPVILAPEVWPLWLDRDVRDPARIAPLLAPAPAEGLIVTPVTAWVNDPKHDDPQCAAPLEPGPIGRGGSVGY